MEVDALLVRSCLYLMSLDELIECSTELKAELLDVLHVFVNKAPQEITFSTMQVSGVKETGMQDNHCVDFGPHSFFFQWNVPR